MLITTKSAGAFDPVKVLNIKILKQAKGELMTTANALLEGADDLGMNDAQRVSYAAIKAELDAVDAGIRRIEIAQEAQRAQGPAQVAYFNGSETAQALARPAQGGRSYCALFGAPRGDTWSAGSYWRTFFSGRYDDRLAPAAMVEGSDPAGGYALPEEMVAVVFDNSLEQEVVRPRATVFGMGAATRRVPAFDASDHGSGLFGGIIARWIPENAATDDVDPKLRQIVMEARKLAIFTKASNELLLDAPNFESTINQMLSKALGWFLDSAFLTGNGVGMPLGVLESNSRVIIEAEEGQGAATIVYANITKMFARLHPGCVGNSIWIASQSAIPQLLSLYLPIGETSGLPVPAVTQDGGKFTLLTRPVIFTEKVPQLGVQGDLCLCDLSQYLIGIRKEVSVDRSTHVGWSTDSTAFRSIVRVDGKESWNQPVQPAGGGDTLSWCVVLEDR